MQSFKDTKDRSWTVAIDVNSIKRVRAELEFNVLDIFDNQMELLARLVDDPIDLIDTIYLICKPQADALGISDEEFGEAIYGDPIDHALRALLDGVTNFFRNPRQREAAKKIVEKLFTTAGIITEQAMKKIDDLDPEQVAKKFIASVSSSPESSGSNPDPEPSAS